MNKVMNIIGEINVNISPSNDTSSEKPSPISDLSFLGYYSLVMVILGTILNLLTLSILFRPVFRNTQARPALHYNAHNCGDWLARIVWLEFGQLLWNCAWIHIE